MSAARSSSARCTSTSACRSASRSKATGCTTLRCPCSRCRCAAPHACFNIPPPPPQPPHAVLPIPWTAQALYDGDATNLKAWWLKCPRNQITTLDTHDGLGVVDVADLMTQEQIDRTKQNIFQRGANANMRYNSAEYGNLDIYQVRLAPRPRDSMTPFTLAPCGQSADRAHPTPAAAPRPRKSKV